LSFNVLLGGRLTRVLKAREATSTTASSDSTASGTGSGGGGDRTNKTTTAATTTTATTTATTTTNSGKEVQLRKRGTCLIDPLGVRSNRLEILGLLHFAVLL